MVAVYDGDPPLFSCLYEKVRVPTGVLIWQQGHSTRAHIPVCVAERLLIERSERVLYRGHAVGQIQVQDVVAIIHLVCVRWGCGIECAIARREEDPPVGMIHRVHDICRQSRSGHPDARPTSIRCVTKRPSLLQRCCVVGQDPTVEGGIVAM